MTWRWTRRTVGLTIGVAVLVTYELLAAFGQDDPTISQIVWAVRSYPAIPFAWGYLTCHFFGSRQAREP